MTKTCNPPPPRILRSLRVDSGQVFSFSSFRYGGFFSTKSTPFQRWMMITILTLARISTSPASYITNRNSTTQHPKRAYPHHPQSHPALLPKTATSPLAQPVNSVVRSPTPYNLIDETGHMIKNCPNQHPPCFICSQTHDVSNCKQAELCFKCGNMGRTSPIPHNPQIKKWTVPPHSHRVIAPTVKNHTTQRMNVHSSGVNISSSGTFV
jgi:hypothetical protein